MTDSTTLTDLTSELADFTRSAAGTLGRSWGSAADAASADLAGVWAEAGAQGWFELDELGGTAALIALERALGRVACPLPVADAYVIRMLLGEDTGGGGSTGTSADLSDGIGEGVIRPVAVFGEERLRTVEAAHAATHVAVIDAGELRLAPIASVTPQPGTPVPAWSSVVAGETVGAISISPAQESEARSLLRLARAARAAAAAEESHRLAVEHAKTRRQFGRPIGAFGAVQQRAAALEIDAASSRQLIDEATRLASAGAADRALAASIAVEHARSFVPGIQAGAQHTLGAVGFFDEHACPWLFRRVHADLAQAHALRVETDDIADALLAPGGTLPSLDRTDTTREYRRSIREFIDTEDLQSPTQQAAVDDPEVLRKVVDKGLIGASLPREYGGEDRDAHDQAVVIEEFGYQRVSAYAALNAVLFLSRAVLDHGTEEQKQFYVPRMRNGELKFCLGYSEPETGSDLASVRTAAVQDGDDWVVNGQKIWTTRAHASEWMWLAARTHPDAPRKQAGITVFLFPLDTPGVTIHNHTSQAGEISCSVFFDDVRIPDRYRIGEPGGGWAVIGSALAGERTSMGAVTAALHRLFDDFLDLARRDPARVGGPGSRERGTVTELAVRLQAGRVLVRSAIDAIAAGGGIRLEAPVAAVAGGELAEYVGHTLADLLGPAALLGPTAEDAVGHGAFAYHLEQASKSVIGGGTNDILRAMIARALGLPRE